jgi:hypothetical protein
LPSTATVTKSRGGKTNSPNDPPPFGQWLNILAASVAVDKSLLVLFFRKEQERKTLLFLKKKKQKDFYSLASCGGHFS